jgi:hypothetical protein
MTNDKPRKKCLIFNLRDFGACADGKTNDAAAIQKAVDACHKAGGGTVFIPPGDYLTGTIDLRTNVTLYLEAGATLWGSKDRKDYRLPFLIYAEDASNVAIRGRGTIDGNGTSFFLRLGEKQKARDWRPSRMLRFNRCENILLEDIQLRNSPAWTVHPVDCERITIRGISILNGVYEEDGPNTDGINPDGCSRVRISDSYIQTGDDSICLKISDGPGEKKVCRDITVTNCVLLSMENALKIGTQTCGEFRNITFSNCAIRDAGCGVAVRMCDGGLIDGLVVNNISMTLPHDGVPIFLWSWRRHEDTPWGTVKNIMISNITATADACIFISGVKERPIKGVTLDNIRIFMRGGQRQKYHASPPYPYPVTGHRRAPYDIFCRYTSDLKLRNIKVTWSEPEKPEWGSAIRCQGVKNLEIAGFEGRQSLGSRAPAVWLKDVKGAFIHKCRAPRHTGTFLKLDEGTEAVTLMHNDLRLAEKIAQIEPSVGPDALFEAGNRPPARAEEAGGPVKKKP